MSKYFKIIIVLIMLGTAGCGSNTKTNKVVKSELKLAQQQWANEITASIDDIGNVTVISENGQTDSTEGTSDKSNKGSNSSISDSNQTSNAGGNTSNGNTSDSNKDSPSNNKPVDNDNQMINVSIAIDCKTILDNKSDLKEGYEKFVPSNGIILNTKHFKVKKGATVIDVLKTATSENNIKLVTVSSGFGLYVKGIGYIEEKVCGSSSGWIYKINGAFINYSASSYRVKEGDKIEWRFTCKQGDV